MPVSCARMTRVHYSEVGEWSRHAKMNGRLYCGTMTTWNTHTKRHRKKLNESGVGSAFMWVILSGIRWAGLGVAVTPLLCVATARMTAECG